MVWFNVISEEQARAYRWQDIRYPEHFDEIQTAINPKHVCSVDRGLFSEHHSRITMVNGREYIVHLNPMEVVTLLTQGAQQTRESIIERVDKVLIREGVGLELRLRIMNDITKGGEQ